MIRKKILVDGREFVLTGDVSDILYEKWSSDQSVFRLYGDGFVAAGFEIRPVVGSEAPQSGLL